MDPIDPDHSDPYTRCRIITMNGIEVEALLFSHQFARNCLDMDVKRRLAEVRYLEQQQQKAVNWLLPGVSSALETTIAYEQVAVDLTEVIPGRPTKYHHRHPADNARELYDRSTAAPISKLHALTIMSAEQQTMNFYLNVGPEYMEPIARQLYQEIALIEEEHVTHYESLVDPGETWWERLVNHEYNECYLYYSFMQTESDRRIKAIWELHLNMELEHLHAACDLMRAYDDREPEEVLAPELPDPVTFEPNKEYLRELLDTQIDLTTLGTGYVQEAHERFEAMQESLMGGEAPPSERVIDLHREDFGTDYRHSTEGEHPVASLRQQRTTS